MSAIYIVPVDQHHPGHVSGPTFSRCGATRPFTDHDYALHTYANSPFDDLASLHHERARAAALHRARVARRQAELRAEAAREQEYFEHQLRLRRAYEEHLVLQQRARALEEAHLQERQRRIQVARAQEARRIAAIADHQRRRQEHHSKAQTQHGAEFEDVIGQLLTSAFGQFFDFTVEAPTTEATTAANPKENDAIAGREASTNGEAAPVATTGTPATAADESAPAAKSLVPQQSHDAAPRPASPTHSHHSETSSRSSSRGRSRQPRVRDVDEDGEEIVLPQDSADEE